MATRKHAPSEVLAAPNDPINLLHDAIIQASEQRWDFYNVPEAERVRLRPGVATLAKSVADRLRVEHAMRAGRP